MFGYKFNQGNLHEAEVEKRKNVHNIEGYIYGIQKDLPLTFNVDMDIESKILVYLLIRMHSINLNKLEINNLLLRLTKYLNVQSNLDAKSNIKLLLQKYFEFKNNLTISSEIESTLDKHLTFLNKTNAKLGTLNFGKSVFEVQDFKIRNIENVTISDFTRILDDIDGLRVILSKKGHLQNFNELEINNLLIDITKYFNFESNLKLKSSFGVLLNKYFEFENINDLFPKFKVNSNAYLNFESNQNSNMGTLNFGKTVSSAENSIISDIENVFISDFTYIADNIYGLKMIIIKQVMVSEVEQLFISNVQNDTIKEFSIKYIS